MINWCTLPRVTEAARAHKQNRCARTHARTLTHTLTHTHTHRGADAHRWHSFTRALGLRERLTRYVGKFTVDDIYGHHIH